MRKRVWVGLSGGVDSSVSAALLKENGHEVVGVFIKTWQPDFVPCTQNEDRLSAMRTAAHLAIPFVTLDLEEVYKKEVADYFIREYARGRTPNPDVLCNAKVKFGAFYKWARRQGADAIATGHYARIEKRGPTLALCAGVDREKDQSYFLWKLRNEQLPHILFPIGDLRKQEVRAFAGRLGLPNANRKDSQGVCFLGAIDMRDFLRHFIATEPGAVVNESGEVVGKHEGALLYTLGQRHGLTIFQRKAYEEPYYVTEKNIPRNTIVVSREHPRTKREAELVLEDEQWLRKPLPGTRVHLRTRYRQPLYAAGIRTNKEGETRLLLAPGQEYPASGQSAVCYDEDVVLGGGIIL